MLDCTTPIDQIVHQASRLFTLPAVAVRILQLTASPKVDVRELKLCLENDPALTSKVMRVVNSSLFGLSCEVADLNQALALLGTKPLKLLVLGFSLPEALFLGVARDLLARYWRDALTKAVAARELCESLWQEPGDEAFVAGLLQDIGMLVLIQDLGRPYITLLNNVHESGENLVLRERESLGFDHVDVSARLLAYWQLPKDLVALMEVPAQGESTTWLPAAKARLPQVLHLADLLVQLVSQHRLSVLPELLEVGHTYRQLNRTQLNKLVHGLEDKVAQLADVLSLDLPDGLGYLDILNEAQARLATEAESAAIQLAAEASTDEACQARLAQASLALAEALANRRAAAAAVAATRLAGSAGSRTADRPPAADHNVPLRAGSHRALLSSLAGMLSRCHAVRSELSLLLADIDQGNGWSLPDGDAEALADLLEAYCRQADLARAVVLRTDDAAVAVLLSDCERPAAVRLANRFVQEFHRYLACDDREGSPLLALNIGVATAPTPGRNFAPETLVQGAERCLYAAFSSEGSSVKSIEVF